MNTQVIPFQFDTSTVRVITTEAGEILFVASDVAKMLGYANPQEAVREHCKKAKSLIDIDGANRSVQQNQQLDRKTKLIPESDVNRLIMRSKLPAAEKIQDWLVEEVLPSIRKTGSYAVEQTIPLSAHLDALNKLVDAQDRLLTLTQPLKTGKFGLDEIQTIRQKEALGWGSRKIAKALNRTADSIQHKRQAMKQQEVQNDLFGGV